MKGSTSSGQSGVRLMKNVAANLSRIAAGWLVVLLMPPILVRSLDPPTYATWMLVLQLGAYASLFEAALQMATARFVAEADSRGDQRRMGSMVTSSALLLTLFGTALLLLIALAAWRLGAFFPSIPPSILPQARLALVITATSLALCLPCSALAGMYVGLQRNEVPALVGGTARILGAAGATWAAKTHHGLVGMALWTAAGTLLQPFLYLFLAGRSTWRPLLRLAHIGRDTLVEFARFCAATVVSQFGTLLITGLDIPIVAAGDFQSAAFYSVAATFSNMLVVPHSAIVSTIMPLSAGVIGEDTERRRGDFLLRTTRFATPLLCLTTFPLMLGMHGFLTLWVGPDYAGHALHIGLILVGAQFLRLTLVPYAIVGFSAGQQARMLVSPFAEGVLNLVLSLILVRTLGAIGVAIGTLCGAVLGITLHFVISMPRTDAVQFSRSQLLLNGILRPILLTLPPLAGYLLLFRLARTSTSQALSLAAMEAALACFMWFLYFKPSERLSLQGLLRRRFNTAPA